MKTFIPGKEIALEDSIDRFKTSLATHQLAVHEASWLNPVPNVWSVHLKSDDCALCFTNGKGATEKAALASAYGEYIERLSTNYFFSDFYLGKTVAQGDFVHYPTEKWFPISDENRLPEGLLTPSLLEFYNPNHELLPNDLIDLQSSAPERGICALPFIQQSTQETVYVPVNLIANLYASNGMSAGNTENEARVQALSEIFERYVKNRIIAEAISLPKIPESVLARYPSIVESIASLEAAGFPIFCFDASLGGQFPVICVVLFSPENSGCFASFGAHPDFGVALERTVTELLQGRALNQLDVFSPPSFENDEVADLSNLETHFIDSSGLISWDLFRTDTDYEFVDWQFASDSATEFEQLLNTLHALNSEVLIMDYRHLGRYACRILAVGVSEIYPPEDLQLANNSMAIHWRDRLLSLPESDCSDEDYLAMIAAFDDEGLDDFAHVRSLLGLATGKDNAWSTLRIGELKAMLALAGHDLEQAMVWIDWTLEVNQSLFSADRSMDYRCLQALVHLMLMRDPDDFSLYQSAFEKMYGVERVATMWAVAQGQSRFHGLFAIDADLTQLSVHQNLLTVYRHLHEALLAEHQAK